MRKTVFIVGAGASLDFGMPLGSGLVNMIRNKMLGELGTHDQPIIESAQQTQLPGDYGEAGRDIAGGMIVARSIDRFLETRKDKPLVTAIGKRAIAAVIAEQEAATPLAAGWRNLDWETRDRALAASSGTWLAKIFSLLQEGIPPAEAHHIFENASFVTFNYDRMIEQYLLLAFQHTMGRSLLEATALLDAIPIIHVYGSLGNPRAQQNSVPFPVEQHHHYYLELMANNLRTFTEQCEDGVLERTNEIIAEAEVIVSLGFAFDPLNVTALFPRPLNDQQFICGTSIGVGPKEMENLYDLTGTKGRPSSFHQTSCPEFVAQHDFRSWIDL
jgi:hypothetical protein